MVETQHKPQENFRIPNRPPLRESPSPIHRNGDTSPRTVETPPKPQPATPGIVIVDIQDTVNAQARDRATEELREEQKPIEGKNKVTRFFKRVKYGVKDTLRRENKRQDKIQQEKAAMADAYTQNMHDTEAAAFRTRFLSTHDELTENHTMVSRRNVLKTTDAKEKTLLGEIATFINKGISGDIQDQKEFTQQKREFFNRMADKYPQYFRKNATYTDNVWEAIQQYKNEGKNEVTIDELDKYIVVGQAKDTLTTDTSNTADRIIEKIGQLSWVNEVTVAAAVATVIGVRDIVSRGALSRGFNATAGLIGVGFLTGAAASSMVAAARTKGEMHAERIFLQREMQKGNGITNKQEKYKRITEYVYDKKNYLSANQTTVTIQELLDKGDIEQARLYAADIDARLKVALQKKVGLFQYETETPALEQVQLEIAKATAKARAMELEQSGKKFDLDYDELVHQKVMSIMTDITVKDKGFRIYRRKEQLKRMGKSLLWSAPGIVTGEFIQSGVFELANHTGMIKNSKHVPVLEKIYDHFHRSTQPIQGKDVIQNPSVPDHFDFVKNGNTFAVQDPNTHKTLLSGLQLNSDGSISDPAKQALAAKHIAIDQIAQHGTQTQMIPQPDQVTYHDQTQFVNNDQWIQTHSDQLTAVHRTEWMNNNSPVPNGSELQLKMFTDPNSLQPDSQGTIVFSVADMKNYLASHGSTVVAPNSVIDNGNMELLISIDSLHSGEVFRIPIGSDGLVHVNVNAPYASLFTGGNGNITFNGSTIEAVQNLGSVNGVEQVRVFATAVGKDNVIAIPTTISVPMSVPTPPVSISKDVITGYNITLKPDAGLDASTLGNEFPQLVTTTPGALETIKSPDNYDLAEAWYLTLGTRAAKQDYVIAPHEPKQRAYMFDSTIQSIPDDEPNDASEWQRRREEIEAEILAEKDVPTETPVLETEETAVWSPLPLTEKIVDQADETQEDTSDEQAINSSLTTERLTMLIRASQRRRIANRLTSLGLYETFDPTSLQDTDTFDEAMDRVVDPANMKFIDLLLKQKDEHGIPLSSDLRSDFGLSERYNRLSFLDSVLRYEEYIRSHENFKSQLVEYENLLKNRFGEIRHEFSGLAKNAITIERPEPEKDELGQEEVVHTPSDSQAQVIYINFSYSPQDILKEIERVLRNS